MRVERSKPNDGQRHRINLLLKIHEDREASGFAQSAADQQGQGSRTAGIAIPDPFHKASPPNSATGEHGIQRIATR